jgi:hypothetical protein
MDNKNLAKLQQQLKASQANTPGQMPGHLFHAAAGLPDVGKRHAKVKHVQHINKNMKGK